MDNLTITPHQPDEINNSEDYLDSRDIQERIDWLESDDASADKWENKEIEEFQEELKALADLKTQYVDSFGQSSWEFGAQFIRESYFEDYAQELAEDIGAINSEASWPNSCIDWEQAARELSMDYTSFDFDGVEYLAREA
jgi:hypothetical protein